jgi:hypothetical protein
MGIEELKLRATFWNNVAVGFLIAGCAAPGIWIFATNPAIAWAPLKSPETYVFIGAVTFSAAAGFCCRARANALIKRVDKAGFFSPASTNAGVR